MLRILSILMVIGGLLAAGIGGASLLEQVAPREAAYDPAPAEVSVEAAPLEEQVMETASAEAEVMEEALPPPAAMKSEDSAVAVSEPTAEIASDMSEEDRTFMFQTQSEEPPAPAMSAPDARRMPDEPIADAAAIMPDPKPSFEDTLKTVPVAHETPRSAEYKRAFDVTFAIDATGDTTAADALPGRGIIEEGEAKVSERVEVRLSGASFNIVAASPPTQSLSPLTENKWRWSVTPLTAGDHDLVFEVFAIDSDSVTPLRTFSDTVTVNVSGINRAIAFADQANPLFVLLGGLGSALAGLFGAIRFFGKR